MKTTPLSVLLGRIAGEYAAKRSIFEIPESCFAKAFVLEAKSPGLAVMSGRASLPVGPAAGPHSQIAPNLVAAYLSGSRVFELKTVQENDHLDIEKPCIEALDEGHNVEWSTELTLTQAREEYLRGWIAVNLLAAVFSAKPRDFFFNMSVGYTLDGIRGHKVDAYIEGMRRPERTAFWFEAMKQTRSFVESGAFASAFGPGARERAAALCEAFPAKPVHSVTLSTMHGCPPAEIERIGRYLIVDKGFDAYVKLNPTLLGYDRARDILDGLGWNDISLKRESFEHDLQFADALKLVANLKATAEDSGREFGIKLSNTLANANTGSFLPGGERYMSGRALFPITVALAADLASTLAETLPDFGARFSYCGGVSALNAAGLVGAGMAPLTIATDILKPGGYQRLLAVAERAVAALPGAPIAANAAALSALAAAARTKAEYRKDWKQGRASIAAKLPVFDCFAAPCIEACPVNQKVPAYIAAAAAGESAQALATILSDNPLPHITGVLCDHVCQEHCSRVDYEGSVRIRDVKLACARACSLPDSAAAIATRLAPETADKAAAFGKVAVVGAGPAGLACAHHLALAGIAVTIFERAQRPGGVPVNVIPKFRIAREDIAADIDRIESLGVKFEFGKRVSGAAELKEAGFSAVFLGIGADSARSLGLAGSGIREIDALEFLETLSGEPAAYAGSKHVVVAGGGNTAMDAVRSATRIPGVRSVKLSYRRTVAEMPADREELENALAEANALATASGAAGGCFLELSLPESAAPGLLTLRKMKLGDRDASGRRSPVPSDETFALPCDILVAAIGESPDRAALESFGVAVGTDGRPVADPATMSAAPGIYVGGDARRGPASIISAEADGRRAAYAILRTAGIEPPAAGYVAPAADAEKLAARGQTIPSLDPADPDFVAREAERCLACDSACLRCVEVCPNRANAFVAVGAPFAQGLQIVHVDRLCNECGNCGVFCPWEGEPFRGKPTLFDTAAELEASTNAGFAFVAAPPASTPAPGMVASTGNSAPDLALKTATGAPVHVYSHAEWNGASLPATAAPMAALARAVWRDHRYLAGGAK